MPLGGNMSRSFTVSGHSSGGSMASQHAIAYSDRIAGLGHYQAAPWGCSHLIDSTENYNEACVGLNASWAMAALAEAAHVRKPRIACMRPSPSP
jgi:poly(3-hydroxybutyrate) depolymerase